MARRKTSITEIVHGGYIGRLLESMPFVARIDPDKSTLVGVEDAKQGQVTAVRELYAQLAHGLGILREADQQVLRQALTNLSLGIPADLAFMSATQRQRGLALGKQPRANEIVQERLDAAVEMTRLMKSKKPGAPSSIHAAAKKLARPGRSVSYLTKAYRDLRGAAEAKFVDEQR